MFRHRKQPSGDEDSIPVDATLEGDIAQVEKSVADYLQSPTDATRQSLVKALEALDAQTDQGDEYGSSVIGSAALGYASKGAVLGETGLDSVVDDVPGAELNAAVRSRTGGQGRGARPHCRHVHRTAGRSPVPRRNEELRRSPLLSRTLRWGCRAGAARPSRGP